MPLEESSDYQAVKEAILKAYELVPEAYRQQFRGLQKANQTTFVEFAREKDQLFTRWCRSEKVDSRFERLKELVLLEDFKDCLGFSVRTYLNEQKVDTLMNAAKLADDYTLLHKTDFTKSNGLSHFKKLPVPGKVAQGASNYNNSFNPVKKPEISCAYCKKKGHILSECRILKMKDGRKSNFPTAVTALKPKSHTARRVMVPEKIVESYQPFMSDGFVSVRGKPTESKRIQILRDTGAAQSLMLKDALSFDEESNTGERVLLQGVSCTSMEVPLFRVNINSDLVSGLVTVGLCSTLPVEGVDMLLGNDLAGEKVRSQPIMVDRPLDDDPTEDENADLYPACVTTRAMAKRVHGDSVPDIKRKVDVDLADTFFVRMEDSTGHPIRQSSKTGEVHGDFPSLEKELFSKQHLVAEQEKDPELVQLRDKASSDVNSASAPVDYYMKDGVLMRKWRPPDVPSNEEWSVKHQVVLPTLFRQDVLSFAHENPLSGHLGVNKTYHKILNHFYWPKIKKDVSEFCRTCHTCQMVGKPNQNIPKAPLQPIPAFDEPFSRVLVDCVGPLPKTKSGNEYLLTIMCASTRFPEAIPLRNIKAKTVIKALTKFFTTFGLPKSIQSDQGTNFMSKVFQQVIHELGIQQTRSSPYHPESQGALERFHQTLKNMIRTYCFDSEKEWDEGIQFLLFAARESVQESLGFSPFELVFGHVVRGPLKLVKEKLLEDDDLKVDMLTYVADFKQRLQRACDLARGSLKQTQSKMKERFDKTTVERSFLPGEDVLALLPIPGRPLQARYFGPYKIAEKASDVNYVVDTPGRRKSQQLCHVNMLKKYFSRENTPRSVGVVLSGDVEKEVQNVEVPKDNQWSVSQTKEFSTRLENSEILGDLDTKLQHLDDAKRSELQDLILEYKHLFPDVPSRTNVIYHDVEVGDAAPIKQHPYRLNPIKQKYLQQEVKYLVENDFVEKSKSNWSSPCILVPKADGTYRMCTDYRKVNTVTKTDSFPIPRVDDCVDKVGQAKYVTKFDLLKGFYQVPLTDRAKEISAFATPDGLYQYKVMPFGMKNSPSTFQRLMRIVTDGLGDVEPYIDDVILCSDTWEKHLELIRQFFDRLSAALLTVNLNKSEFCRGTVTYLGHVVGQGEVRPVSAKIQAVEGFPVPTGKKQLMRFLGMAGYYRKFCKNFSVVAVPLTNLLKKGTKFVWNKECQESFEKLKSILSSAPVLAAPRFDQSFTLAVDASDDGVGAVLLQDDSQGIEHPVCYFSKKFLSNQRNYSTVEKECLGLVLAVQHFEVYISASPSPITVFTDHNPLVFIAKMKHKNQRLLRWSLLLQEYNLCIKHIKGTDNVLADALSRGIG